MKGFIHHLVSNHTKPVNNVQPRLKGRFESFSAFQQTQPNDFTEDNIQNETASVINKNAPDKPNIPGVEKNNAPFSSVTTNILQPEYRNNESSSYLLTPPAPLQTTETPSNNNNFQADQPGADILPQQIRVISPEDTNTSDHQKTESTKEGDFFLSDQEGSANMLQQQKVQLNNQLEVNMSFINAFRQLHKNDAPENISATETSSVIKVNIGRIDVRAVTQPAQQTREKARPAQGMSLDDFLKKKNGSK